MATPQELVAADDARQAKAKAAAEARRAAAGPANDNAPRAPDGHIMVNGVAMPYWLPPGAGERKAGA